MANELIKPGETHAEYNVFSDRWKNLEDHPLSSDNEAIVQDLHAVLLDSEWRPVAAYGLYPTTKEVQCPKKCGVAFYLPRPVTVDTLSDLVCPDVASRAHEEINDPQTHYLPGRMLHLEPMNLGCLAAVPVELTDEYLDSLTSPEIIDQIRLRFSRAHKWEPPIWRRQQEVSGNVLLAEFNIVNILDSLDLAMAYRRTKIQASRNEIRTIREARERLRGNSTS